MTAVWTGRHHIRQESGSIQSTFENSHAPHVIITFDADESGAVYLQASGYRRISADGGSKLLLEAFFEELGRILKIAPRSRLDRASRVRGVRIGGRFARHAFDLLPVFVDLIPGQNKRLRLKPSRVTLRSRR